MELKKIRLIDAPKKEFALTDAEKSSLLGGRAFYCPNTYSKGGLFAGDHCTGGFDSGNCGDSRDYCGSYTSCTLKLG